MTKNGNTTGPRGIRDTLQRHSNILLLAVILGFTLPWLKYQFKKYAIHDLSESSAGQRLFTTAELAQYNGEDDSPGLYIAILGSVYNVEKGKKHYGPDGSYHVFAARDASVAFVSGDFNKDTPDQDDVLKLSPSELIGLENWKSFFDKQYEFKGLLIGRFYDGTGNPTDYHRGVQEKLEIGKSEENSNKLLKEEFPPCNVEWKADIGSRVWCTDKSGGVSRDWIGYPRKLYEPGKTDFRCACIKTDGLDRGNIKEYEDCDPESHSCIHHTTDNV